MTVTVSIPSVPATETASPTSCAWCPASSNGRVLCAECGERHDELCADLRAGFDLKAGPCVLWREAGVLVQFDECGEEIEDALVDDPVVFIAAHGYPVTNQRAKELAIAQMPSGYANDVEIATRAWREEG